MKLIMILSTLVMTLFLSGCGGGSEGGSPDNTASAYNGHLIDSPIVGMSYECGDKKALTDAEGGFYCSTMPVTFKVGNYTVGTLTTLTADGKVYPQDLLGLDRNDSVNADLIELVQFLQSLDDDGDISDTITISQERQNEFENIHNDSHGSAGGSSSGDGAPGVPDGAHSPSDAGRSAGLPLPNPATAMDHLRKTIDPTNYRVADTSDISPYVGSWIGDGWGWEVRFKQDSGDFVSQFTGTDRNDLPFSGEKTIMSLMVTHQTAFHFQVDEDGQIDGEAVITYDVLPNLCGLNALTSELVNGAVGNFDKIFTLGGMVENDFMGTVLNKNVELDTRLFSLLKDTVDPMASFIGSDWATVFTETARNIKTSSKGTGDICKVAADDPSVAGGVSVGPLSLSELIRNGSLDVAKSLLTPEQPFGFILAVPGVTQVQYEYKGLENGPETRTFAVSGYIDDNGKMFLRMGDVTQGSDDLTIEYTVNYETEHPTFPVWSPFLDEGGSVYPGDRDVIVYDYVTKEIEKSYTEYAINSAPVKKTVMVPTPVLEPKTVHLTLPMATFKASGSHRNDVSVWHEYEYGWNAYKVAD